MMFRTVLPLVGCLVGLLGLSPMTAWGQAESVFQRTGVVERLDLGQDTLVVNDQSYGFPAAARVYTFDPAVKDPQAQRDERRRKDRQALQKGMRIGYVVEGEGGGKRGWISEAWILPPGMPRTSSPEGGGSAPGKAAR